MMTQCAVSYCKAKKRPFHPFPENDQQLFDIWKGCVSNFQFSMLTDEEILKQYIVCDDHFVDSCKILGTNNLKKFSIPTLNVSGFKTNPNLSIAYNLYIEKQENDSVNQSIKNINLDHNYVDKVLSNHNTLTKDENLDNGALINLNSEPRIDLMTKIWVDEDIEFFNQNLSPQGTHDPLSKNNDIGDEERNQDIKNLLEDGNDLLEQEIISMQNITDPLIIRKVKKEPDNKSVLKSYSGITKQITKTIDSNKLTKSNTKCSVPGCYNKYGSFHKFPTSPILCKRWTESLGIKNKIKDYMKICSVHFKKTDYFTKFTTNRNSRRLLKKNAVPFNTQPKKIICAANNCFNNNIDHKRIHYFPFPTDETLARIWAKNADREDLFLQPKFAEKKYYLCANHFEKSCFKKGSKTEHRSDTTIIPTIFNNIDCLINPGDLYCNLFTQTSEPDFRNTSKTENGNKNHTNSNTLQTYVNDSDISKITFDDERDKSSISYDYGEINYSYTLYEDFVTNPGVLNLKPQPSDLLFKKDYCRLCAKLCSVATLISIFDKSGNFTMYGKMLEMCLPGKVHAEDKLPHWMCSKCEYKLDVCCSSLEAFIRADNELRKIFHNNLKETHRQEISIIDDTEFMNEKTSNIKQVPNVNQVSEKIKINNENAPNMPPEINKIIDEKQMEENKKYQCLNCDQLYNTKKELVDHSLAAHNSDRSQSNIVCKIVPGGAKSIASRTADSNSKVKCSKLRYECVICSSLHEKKDSLIKHSLRYHSQPGNNGKIVCRVVRINNLRNNHLTCLHCKEEFRNINTYRKHMKQHLKLNCEQCGKQFTRMYKLLAHVKLHEIKSVVCPKYPQLFKDNFELLKHQVTHAFNKCSVSDEKITNSAESLKYKKKNERSLCNICGKLFSSSTLLKYHLERHTDLRPHKCSICSKAFQTLLSLKRHKRIHSTEKRCICQICGKQFGYLSVLKSHMYSHSTHRPYICELCGAGFHRRNNLKKHLTTHEKIKENPYECKTCHIEFNSRIMYIRHKQEHSIDKKSFTCDICSKIFLTKFQVKIHRRIHTGETPFGCEQCGKSFRSRALLKQHRLIHMNVFPHQCNYCDRKFRRLQSLVVHRRTHTGEKPYPCPICGRAFANRSDMNKHKRNLHIRKNKQLSTEDNETQFNTHFPDADKQLDIDNILNQVQDAIYRVENDDLQSNSCGMLPLILHE